MRGKNRLDQALVSLGMADNLDQAARLVVAGRIWVDGQRAVKPDQKVGSGSDIQYQPPPAYVSRGGRKLEGALDHFPITVQAKICADVGASTGGFTDCLLQHGASRVYAIDVGRGQLHWKLRQDERVISMERTDARKIDLLPEPVGLITVDAAFISLKALLPTMAGWLADQGDLVALVKPQFEARPEEVEAGGVVRSKEVKQRILKQAIEWLADCGAPVQGLLPSPLPGPKGNQEFFLWGVLGGRVLSDPDLLLANL